MSSYRVAAVQSHAIREVFHTLLGEAGWPEHVWGNKILDPKGWMENVVVYDLVLARRLALRTDGQIFYRVETVKVSAADYQTMHRWLMSHCPVIHVSASFDQYGDVNTAMWEIPREDIAMLFKMTWGGHV